MPQQAGGKLASLHSESPPWRWFSSPRRGSAKQGRDRHFQAILPLFGKVLNTERTRIDEIIKSDKFKNLIIAIGDIVVSNLAKIGRQANISIFDFKTNRTPITDQDTLKLLPKADVKAKNEASTINNEAVSVLNSMLKKGINSNRKYSIEIEGEEDLLAIPAILLAPLGSIVLYGIRNAGGIKVEVSEKKKIDARSIVNKFDILKLK
mgnify:CR=1 FL=1